MNFPYSLSVLDDRLMANWRCRFSATGGYDRSIRENVWRRHQAEENKELSLWGQDGTWRRRLLFFHDQYDIHDNHFCLDSSYIFTNTNAPQSEVLRHLVRLMYHAGRGGWEMDKNKDDYKLLSRQDLVCEMVIYEDNHDHSYLNLDVTVRSKLVTVGIDLIARPWTIFRTGIRKKLSPGTPTLIGAEDLKPYLPAVVALGCGPSIEAGIPPLNYLHSVYCLSRPDGKFVLKPEDDNFMASLLKDPEEKYRSMTAIHRACLKAEPTAFYCNLKKLHDAGHVVGPIITNNFDGLCLSVGLPELPMRQFDKEGVYPDLDFRPDAKSLLVIGSHADRRGVEASARKKGLKIIYIDPCGYEEVPYPLEAPQDNDLLFCRPASLAMSEFCKALGLV